ncbi:MAG: methyltransferase [Bacteroidetes bacterium]|nr:methyltransferase [Bacteroidota bacterium]
MSKPFHFKYFYLYDDQSTMKIGTDAVLLGAWTETGGVSRILDAGTGCGIIALMLAQRSQSQILAIDIDSASVEQSSRNFRISPWKERLEARQISIQELALHDRSCFGLIVSNPPYFSKSLKPGNQQRKLARHDDMLTPEELIISVDRLLLPAGRFNVVLPSTAEASFLSLARIHNLWLENKLTFIPIQGKRPNRILLSFSRSHSDSIKNEILTMRNADGTHTDEFVEFTKDYYLFDPEMIRERLNTNQNA